MAKLARMAGIEDNARLIRKTKKFLQHLTTYQTKLVSIRDDYQFAHASCYLVMPIACFLAMLFSAPFISFFHRSAGWMFAIFFPLFSILIMTSVITGFIQNNYNNISIKLEEFVKIMNRSSLEISQKQIKDPNVERLEAIRKDVLTALKYAASLKDVPLFQFIDVHFKPFV